ncbi:hypothetical protein TKK_0017712 [Trichogramma kaykai]
MDSSASMADYVAKIVSLAQRLKDMDMEQKEPVIIAKILSSIPEKYDNVRTAWYAVPRDKQTLEKLTDHLLNYLMLNVYSDTWYADSGATEHLCMKRECFTNIDMIEDDSHKVKVGDGNKLAVKGVGNVSVRATKPDGSYEIYNIRNVWYVPDIKKNLISIGRSTEKGMEVTFKKGGKKNIFVYDGKLIAEGSRSNGSLYKLNLRLIYSNGETNVANGSLMEWHEKLGHVNFQTLRKMIHNNTVNDLVVNKLEEKDPFCEGCVLGKQHRNSFPKNEATRSKTPGELFHVDLCGKMSISSIGGANYFMLLKDDYFKYSYVYCLKEKSEVMKQFAPPIELMLIFPQRST